MYKSQFKKNEPYDWFCGPGSHIRMISEVSYCTEDWSIGCFATIETHYTFQIVTIYLLFCLLIDWFIVIK